MHSECDAKRILVIATTVGGYALIHPIYGYINYEIDDECNKNAGCDNYVNLKSEQERTGGANRVKPYISRFTSKPNLSWYFVYLQNI